VRNAPIFIDTAYVHALIGPNDQWHEKAVEWQLKIESEKSPLVTTEFVLAEIADSLAAINFRQAASQAIHIL
jgi:predicted nucleic acid-binding protein